MKATIKDVATRANVSVATVSRVVNNLDGYSDETKEKVLEAIKELGYQRNAIARGLVTKTTKTIGVLIPIVSAYLYAEILNGIEEKANENGYGIFLCNTGVNGVRAINYIKMLGERQVDAIIVVSLTINDEYYNLLNSLKIPYILVSTLSYKYKIPYIKVDDQQAAYTATQFLIEKGHTKIALISGGKEDKISGITRVNGYRNALQDYDININEYIIKYGDFTYNSGIMCMEDLLQEKEDFTAVFATSDEMALGALSVMHRNKIEVPEKISIIGYDNTLIAQMSNPPLTTVAQPLYEMGVKAFAKILSVLETGNSGDNVILSHKIVERETVKLLK
ncbi:LacI family DNA-binding transcriptional regulator [Clostridium neonatale]|uniref:LacI family DNA-binding transcriptional regulator n=1 Tax=Clostridium neonatale TaxID=137838 RepID=UPI00291BEA35|nr:LacI family DNA-binding transcriptional regulator [Clostridium neonatale]CAI3215796.1 putative transcriptional regulator [Clostridium neonatale]